MAIPRICKVDGCGKPHHARGYCGAHLQRLRRVGSPLGARTYQFGARCSVDGCGKRHHANGFCSAHGHRFRRHGDPTGGDIPRGYVQQFLEEIVLAYDGDECLFWPFAKDGHGYAQIGNDGERYVVSRLVCERAHGPAPTPEHEAAHSCGRGTFGCVTKRHLDWKTRAENQADRILHGTSNRGERHGMSKLTETDVIEIRSLRGHIPQREIAERFGIHQSTVSGILHRKAWAWL